MSIWNSLPNWVVSANTTNTFKNKLARIWQNREIIYDFKAQLEGTGSRSNGASGHIGEPSQRGQPNQCGESSQRGQPSQRGESSHLGESCHDNCFSSSMTVHRPIVHVLLSNICCRTQQHLSSPTSSHLIAPTYKPSWMQA